MHLRTHIHLHIPKNGRTWCHPGAYESMRAYAHHGRGHGWGAPKLAPSPLPPPNPRPPRRKGPLDPDFLQLLAHVLVGTILSKVKNGWKLDVVVENNNACHRAVLDVLCRHAG